MHACIHACELGRNMLVLAPDFHQDKEKDDTMHSDTHTHRASNGLARVFHVGGGMREIVAGEGREEGAYSEDSNE